MGGWRELEFPEAMQLALQPQCERKIEYVEETIRAMENGNLKIRVRSLENEKSLERMAMTQENLTSLVVASVFVNLAVGLSGPVGVGLGVVGGAVFGLKAFIGNAKIKKFDKTQAKFENNSFEGDK